MQNDCYNNSFFRRPPGFTSLTDIHRPRLSPFATPWSPLDGNEGPQSSTQAERTYSEVTQGVTSTASEAATTTTATPVGQAVKQPNRKFYLYVKSERGSALELQIEGATEVQLQAFYEDIPNICKNVRRGDAARRGHDPSIEDYEQNQENIRRSHVIRRHDE